MQHSRSALAWPVLVHLPKLPPLRLPLRLFHRLGLKAEPLSKRR